MSVRLDSLAYDTSFTQADAERAVVVADADPRVRRLIAQALARDAIRVVEAGDGVELLAHLCRGEGKTELRARIATTLAGDARELRFAPSTLDAALGGADVAAVVAASYMLGVSGVDVLRLLRSAGCATPFILLADLEDCSVRLAARQLRARIVRGTPVDPERVRVVIREVLGLHGRQRVPRRTG